MVPMKLDIIVRQGSSLMMTLVYRDQSTRFRKRPVDLTDHQPAMQIRERFTNELILDLTDEYISIGDGIRGEIVLNVPTEVTEDLDFSNALYDIEVITPEGDTHRLFEGSVYLSKEVTK